MSKVTLLLLQVGVAIAALSIWYVFTTYPVFGKMFPVAGATVIGRAPECGIPVTVDGGWNVGVSSIGDLTIESRLGADIMNKKESLDSLAKRVAAENVNPKPRSGKQEQLENLINRFV